MTSSATQLAVQRLGWIVPQWSGPAAVSAFFTTRDDDVAAAPMVNPGQATSTLVGKTATPVDSRARLRALLPGDPVVLAQVHGRDVVTIDRGNLQRMLATPPVADAAMTRTHGVPLVVRTADCLPVLLSDRAGRVIGVAHAGWRGLASGVLESTVAAMGVLPGQLVAWIGPAIGPSAFEVGPDVYDAYCDADAGATSSFTPLRAGKWMADLPALARRRLAAVGVPDVSGGHWCTFTDAARFFSWRRDGKAGRMCLVAWIDHAP